MKRPLLICVLFAGAAALLSGQSSTVVIQNAEEEPFYYVIDPPELTVFDTASVIFENVVHDYFAEAPTAADDFSGFTELPPGEALSLENLAAGKHLLVGFFLIPGQREFPVRVVTLQAGGGMDKRTYRIFSQPALISARAGRGRIGDYAPISPQAAVAAAASVGTAAESSPAVAESSRPAAEEGFFRFEIDNEYEDWEAIPTFLSFPSGRRLPGFTREQYGGPFEVLPIEQSRHWGSAGTGINEIKMVLNERAVYLYISTHSALAPNVSVFLYFHSDSNLRRPGATNRFTLELVPASGEEPGLVVLWEQGRKPLIVGTLASGSFFMEAEIDTDLLYDLLQAKPAITFFDLTTGIFDRQQLSFEEFYMASVALGSIPTEETLY